MSTIATLELIRGIGPSFPDTESLELQPDPLNLLNPGGFSLAPDGYIPNFPQTKSGGIIADSPIADGDILVAAAQSGVEDVLRLQAKGASFGSRYLLQAKLAMYGDYARRFYTSFAQIEPVFLKMQTADEPGPRYAVISDIQIAQSRDPFARENINELTITIRRGPYWTPHKRGAHPKLWAFEKAGTVNPSFADLNLGTTSNYLIPAATIQNKHEWDASGSPAFVSKNFIDIPADKIPGDAPALLQLYVSAANVSTLYLARSTKPTAYAKRTGDTWPNTLQHNMLPAGDTFFTGLPDVTLETDTGGVKPAGGANALRARVNFATSTAHVLRMRWRGSGSLFSGGGTGGYPIDFSNMRGKFAVFLRARQHSGAVGDAKVSLRFSGNVGNAYFETPQSTIPIVSGTGNTTSWPLVYMGEVSIPWYEPRSIQSLLGTGLEANQRAGLYIDLYASRAGSTAVLYIADLVLMPVDEMMIRAKFSDSASFSPTALLDGTGHLLHGADGSLVAQYGSTDIAAVAEVTGQFIELVPGVNNRLYFLGCDAAELSACSWTFSVAVNILPQWRGARAV